MTILSPCVRACSLDLETRICSGCGRTLQEIGGWSRMTDAERQRVMDRLDAARAQDGMAPG